MIKQQALVDIYEMSNKLYRRFTFNPVKIEHTYCVYILECKDGSYYTGITNDLERRLSEHNTGQDETCYTFLRRPAELKQHKIFTDVNQAIASEKQLKGGSGKKKQALIEGNIERLKAVAKSKKKT